MKTLPLVTSVALAAGLVVSVAAAQDSSQPATTAATFATPTSPAPAVAVQAPAAPERIIYVPRLPSAADLTNIARAQGVAIDQIDQTANDVTIRYRFSDGRTSSVAYQLLPSGGTMTAEAPAAVVGKTAPTVVYYTPAPQPQRVYYYAGPAYYDPFYYPWYGPVSVSLGFGFGHYYGGHGHYRGGFHGHGHGHGHGRW